MGATPVSVALTDDLSISDFKLPLDLFQAWRDDRPKEEKWELIAGTPVMMPPPALGHQRISAAIMEMLNARLAISRPDWEANMEIGVLTEDKTFNPEPDVTVIDVGTPSDELYAARFYFVTEVLSPNDKQKVLRSKLGYYQRHEHCLGIMFVKPDKVSAELHVREEIWKLRKLTKPDDRVVIPVIGDIGALIDLYRRTELHPARRKV